MDAKKRFKYLLEDIWDFVCEAVKVVIAIATITVTLVLMYFLVMLAKI